MRDDLPSGTVTLFFTDVEGSTRLLKDLGDAYPDALAQHRLVLEEACSEHGGVLVDTQGDATFYAFSSASDAFAAAEQAQQALHLPVRMGIHTGEPTVTEGGYVGYDVHRAARIAAAGHGGQVLVSAATAALVGTDRLRDLGEHRLKDLSAPERIYQLGAEDFPRIRSLHQTNLPVPATPFLGRATELGHLIGLLSQPDVRLLTLTGPGGTGKTRLALQAAVELASSYPDGVWWVPLAPLRDPGLVIETAGQALGSDNGLAEHIAERSLLLLFDNFEHVVEAAAGLAGLLASCPKLNVLVTSREPLHVTGEQEYPVAPLAHAEGVSLFLARARAVKPDFRADEAVPEICRRLDDLPLALELAAARVKALVPREILVRLEQRLPLLTGGARDVPARQRTLRATLDWSYELLAPEEQRLFARLAAFRGGCTLQAAEEVAGADLDSLQSLVDKSLLRHSGDRFWMLETIREYASEQLEICGERQRVETSHADYFLSLAERAEPKLHSADAGEWLAVLEREHDNLRAALTVVRESPLQLRLAAAMWWFWLDHGHVREGRAWLGAALAHREKASAHDLSRALRGAAALARVQGDLPEADRYAGASVAAARSGHDRPLEARALGTLATVALARGEPRRAAELLAEADAMFRELGDEPMLAVGTGNRAYLALELGDAAQALALAREAVELSRKVGHPSNELSALLNFAIAAHELGDARTARHALCEGLTHARELGHTEYLCAALTIAAATLARTEPRTAAVLLAACERARDDLALKLGPIEEELRASTEALLLEAVQHENLEDANRTGSRLSVEQAAELALRAVLEP